MWVGWRRLSTESASVGEKTAAAYRSLTVHGDSKASRRLVSHDGAGNDADWSASPAAATTDVFSHYIALDSDPA